MRSSEQRPECAARPGSASAGHDDLIGPSTSDGIIAWMTPRRASADAAVGTATLRWARSGGPPSAPRSVLPLFIMPEDGPGLSSSCGGGCLASAPARFGGTYGRAVAGGISSGFDRSVLSIRRHCHTATATAGSAPRAAVTRTRRHSHFVPQADTCASTISRVPDVREPHGASPGWQVAPADRLQPADRGPREPYPARNVPSARPEPTRGPKAAHVAQRPGTKGLAHAPQWISTRNSTSSKNPVQGPAPRSFRAISVDAVFDGLRSTSTRAAVGTSSRRSSNRFPSNSLVKKLIPVRLPPGWARLATRPRLTGSSTAGCLRHAVGEIGCANGLVPPDRSEKGRRTELQQQSSPWLWHRQRLRQSPVRRCRRCSDHPTALQP